MKRRLVFILLCFTLTQCEPLGGAWYTTFQNDADFDVVVEIDVEDIGGDLYPRHSYDDLVEPTVEYVLLLLKAKGRAAYVLDTPYSYSDVHISDGDSVSVYAFHPDTLKKYSWEDIRKLKKYWFARVKIPMRKTSINAIYFPFELNGK